MAKLRTIVKLDALNYTRRIQLAKGLIGRDPTNLVNEVIDRCVNEALKAIGKDLLEFSQPNEQGVTKIRFSGDSVEIIFDSAVDAHNFAQKLHGITQRYNKNNSSSLGLWFRIGAATGEISKSLREKFYHGDVFITAHRLEPKAELGEFLIHTSTFKLLPLNLKKQYASEEEVLGKRNEKYRARRCRMVVVPKKVPKTNKPKTNKYNYSSRKTISDKNDYGTGIYMLLTVFLVLVFLNSIILVLKNRPRKVLNKQVDYTKLEQLLILKRWWAADIETNKKMLEQYIDSKQSLSDRGYLDNTEMINFPCKDLLIIDNLWVKYSKGKFGFSVQKEVTKNLTKEMNKEEKKDEISIFGKHLGWNQDGKWLPHGEHNFSLTAPKGHLPKNVLQNSKNQQKTFYNRTYTPLSSRLYHLLSRTEFCKTFGDTDNSKATLD